MTAGAIGALGTSVMSMSSPTAVWSMVNQLQLFLLLILTRAYLPESVVQFIVNNEMFAFSLDFLSLADKMYIDKFEYLNYEQSNDRLESIGIESGSAFINNYYFLLTMLFIFLFHLGIMFIPK